jgi:tetratricopeptide (TPR) repeat protein
VALVANNLGHVYAHRGAIFAAQKQWNEAQELYQEVGDFEGSIRVLVNLGAISTDLGQYDEARAHLEQAQTLAQKVRSLPGQCFSALNLGLVAHRQAQHAVGVEWLNQALTMAKEMGARRLEGAALTALGHALAGNGQIAEAGDAYWEALAIWNDLNLANLSAEAQAGLARIALRNGTAPLAMHFVEQILAQMERDEALGGSESPVAIYLTCYRVLAKVEDARAAGVLKTGRQLLMARLDGITDESAREAVLRNIPAHRELLAAAGPG